MEITAEEFKKRYNSGEELHILDVREEWEFDEGHIKGARHFSLYNIPTEEAKKLEDWRNKEIIIHCKTGVRGKKAQYLLAQMGFDNVLNLVGGYEAFRELQ